MDLCNINVIRALLEEHGFKFSKALGQNFLINAAIPQMIAGSSMADKNSGVLEIGPGIGCLTKELAVLADKVAAVELDKRLPDVLKVSLAEFDNIEIISGDIMKLDISEIIDTKFQGLTPRVCANLPYNITTPVLTKLIACGRFETITVMIQREVAKRICASPASSDYGAFGIFVGYYMEPELLFDVSPDCFMPQPKVTSSVIRLTRRKTPPVDVKDTSLLFRVIKGAFAQRRKTLLNSLSSSFPEIPKQALSDTLIACNIDLKTRGEVLDLQSFAYIANALYELKLSCT